MNAARVTAARVTAARALVFACAVAATILLPENAARAGDDWDDGGDVIVREAWHRADYRRLAVKFPVGRMQVVGTAGDSIVLVLKAHCEVGSAEDCDDVIRRFNVREREHGKALELTVVGKKWFDTSRPKLEARLEVPSDLALELAMKVGELEVAGLTSDARLELGVGEATVHSAKESFRKASVRAWIGETTLVREGHSRGRSGILGNSLVWEDGAGAAELGLSVGIGEASVYLD